MRKESKYLGVNPCGGSFLKPLRVLLTLGACGLLSIVWLTPKVHADASTTFPAHAQKQVIYSFTNVGNGDGYSPNGGLVADFAGNLYGTTSGGGSQLSGLVFELSPNPDGSWTETIIHSFDFQADGADPLASVVMDASGNLYGTCQFGGSSDGTARGTVFKLTPNGDGTWTFSVIHRFAAGEAIRPIAPVIVDAAGNVYGTAPNRPGDVFELVPQPDGSYDETILYSFSGPDGAGPSAGLALDASGNVYGTTVVGGAYHRGTVFQLSPQSDGSWVHATLYDFQGPEGGEPLGDLLLDAAGNLFGTLASGGKHRCDFGSCGTVFELSPASDGGWNETTIFYFGEGNGATPIGGLVMDATGNLYGTTSLGGVLNTECGGIPVGCGTVHELSPNSSGWTQTVLYLFQSADDGFSHHGNVLLGPDGTIFGTTAFGGTKSGGTVFKLTQSTRPGKTEKHR